MSLAQLREQALLRKAARELLVQSEQQAEAVAPAVKGGSGPGRSPSATQPPGPAKRKGDVVGSLPPIAPPKRAKKLRKKTAAKVQATAEDGPRRADVDDPSVVLFDPSDAAWPIDSVVSGAADDAVATTNRTGADASLMDCGMAACLASAGFPSLFAVQRTFVPLAVRNLERRLATGQGSDLFLSAPTGCGKTLAYCIPIMQHLLRCCALVDNADDWRLLPALRPLRALVIVPTRDLAVQALRTLQQLMAAADSAFGARRARDAPPAVASRTALFRAAAVFGAQSFRQEQEMLQRAVNFDNGGGDGGASFVPVDVLVATPGRLVDHLRGTPALSLRQLQVLVLDEADRLLAQSYHGFLAQTLEACVATAPADSDPASPAARPSPPASRVLLEGADASDAGTAAPSVSLFERQQRAANRLAACAAISRTLDTAAFDELWRHRRRPLRERAAVSGDGPVASGRGTSSRYRRRPSHTPLSGAALARNHPALPLTVLCSATLSRKSELVTSLHLQDPVLVRAATTVAGDSDHDDELLHSASGSSESSGSPTPAKKARKYTLPATLDQRLIVCPDALKLPALLWILRQVRAPPVSGDRPRLTLVFCSSVESTHRLARLLQLLGESAGEYSGAVSAHARSRALARFRKGATPVLVCSDAMARGIDCDDVYAVVSYDCPAAAKTYVHRAGRTARAGATGLSLVLAHRAAARHLQADLEAKVTGGELLAPVSERPTDGQLRALADQSQLAERTARLAELLVAEQAGRVVPGAKLGAQWMGSRPSDQS